MRGLAGKVTALLLVCLVSLSQRAVFTGFPAPQDETISSLLLIQDFYVNTTWAGSSAQFAFDVSDDAGLAIAVFGCNVTTDFINDTALNLGGTRAWANFTQTLPNYNCIISFQLWLANTYDNLTTTGLRYMKVYTFDSTAGAWNNPFNDLGAAISAVEAANNWGQVENYTQTMLDQQPGSATTYLSNLIDSFDTSYSNQGWQAATGNQANGWTNPTNAYDGNTATAAGYAWKTAGNTNALVLNFSTTIGNMIRYFVKRNNTAVTEMIVDIANQTGSWVSVADLTPPGWGACNNLSFSTGYSQYTAIRISFAQHSATQSNATIYEVNALNYATVTPANPTNILMYSAECNKLGITRQQAIKDALASFTMVGNLPSTTSNGSYRAFSPENRWALYGFWYANNSWANANMTQWNITAAYNQFDTAVNYSVIHGATQGLPLYIYSDGTGNTISNRYYDEEACTIDCYLIFYSLLNISDALNKALYWWSYLNTQCWTGTYYKYTPSVDIYECEASFFLKIMSILKYTHPSVGNWANVLTDIGNRFLSQEWNSAQWVDSTTGITSYAVVHANTGNPQRRMQNTLGGWQALLGVYGQLNSTYKANMIDMLYGNNNVQPAWALLLTPDNASFPTAYPGSTGAGLFNATSNLFSGSSADGYAYNPRDYNATAEGEELLFMLGIVPGTTTIAFPLEELGYEYVYDIDPTLLQVQIDASTRDACIPVSSSGALTFQYGVSPITYNFSQAGIWQISFTNSWNMIANATYQGALPSNLIYFNQIETHDISITNLTCSEPNPVLLNDSVTISVTLQNEGIYTESFEVGVNCTFVNETVVGAQAITLAHDEITTLNFTWSPQDVGVYAVKAFTSEIAGDTSPDDNTSVIYVQVTYSITMGGSGGRMPCMN